MLSKCLVKVEMERKQKIQGSAKSVLEKKIKCKNLLNCLFTGRKQLRKINVFRSHNHQIYTEEVNKIALSSSDDKSIICKDNISTLSKGRWSTGKSSELK